MDLNSAISAKLAFVITTLSGPESKVTKRGRFGTGYELKRMMKMEQLFMEMQHLADQAICTFSNAETIQLMIDSAAEKCRLYYL